MQAPRWWALACANVAVRPSLACGPVRGGGERHAGPLGGAHSHPHCTHVRSRTCPHATGPGQAPHSPTPLRCPSAAGSGPAGATETWGQRQRARGRLRRQRGQGGGRRERRASAPRACAEEGAGLVDKRPAHRSAARRAQRTHPAGGPWCGCAWQTRTPWTGGPRCSRRWSPSVQTAHARERTARTAHDCMCACVRKCARPTARRTWL